MHYYPLLLSYILRILCITILSWRKVPEDDQEFWGALFAAPMSIEDLASPRSEVHNKYAACESGAAEGLRVLGGAGRFCRRRTNAVSFRSAEGAMNWGSLQFTGVLERVAFAGHKTGVPLTWVLETVVFARPEKCFPGMRRPWLSDP